MKPETACATSITRAHHQSEAAAATTPSSSRGISSRQPACLAPRGSWVISERPIQPMTKASAAEVTTQTASQASWTSQWP